MTTHARRLDVRIDDTTVGSLVEEGVVWRFDYDPAWQTRRDGFDLAPNLPRAVPHHVDGASVRPVQAYFDNLLPEELLRQTIAKEAGVRGDDAFALLEYLGAESAGSLTLVPPGAAPMTAGRMQALPAAVLSQRIRALPQSTLGAQSPKRMSLAGAQHKLVVIAREPGRRGRNAVGLELFEPVGAQASTHILKPDHPDTDSWPASVACEYLTMRLARAVGLHVPKVWRLDVPQPVYVAERFDRVVTWNGRATSPDDAPAVSRRHVIDACQMLGIARQFKHSGASVETLARLVALCTNKAAARQRIFAWLAFNTLVANDDCHLKNLSFLIGPDGVAVAPHYDLLATGAYATRAFAHERARWPDLPLGIALPGAATFAELTRLALLAAADELGLPSAPATRMLDTMGRKLEQALAVERAHLDVRRRTAGPLKAALETRMLDVIDRIVVREMLARTR